METLAGVSGATRLQLGVRSLERSPLWLSGFQSRQFCVGKSSWFIRFDPFASIEENGLSAVQKSGGRRLDNFKIFAKVGEETESTQDNAGTTDVSKVVKGKGFGAPKRVVGKKKSSSAPSSRARRAPPQNPVLGAQVDEGTKQVGEEAESTLDSAGTTEVPKVVQGKGFGAPKPVVEKRKSTSPPSSSTRRAPPQNPFLGAEVDEKTKQFETGFVASLAFLFFLVILEGLALAASGFLPEDWDDFLLQVIYPIFTPTVGVFFAGAAGYGVWKVFGQDGKKGPPSK